MDQRLQDPAGAAPPDWRGLCEELAREVQQYALEWDDEFPKCLVRARAALAHPEPEVVGPSDEELLRMAAEALGYERIGPGRIYGAAEAYGDELLAFARAILARWGHQPAPSAEDDCPACEGVPKPGNQPCAVCGRPALAAEADGPAVQSREPASVVGEPSDEEIMELMPPHMHEDFAFAARAMANEAGTDSQNAKGFMRIALNRHAVDLALAVLARFGRPAPAPAEGEVADETRYLVKELHDQADDLSPSLELFGLIHRAAELLERQAAPVPVPGASHVYFEFVISDADDCTQAGGIAPTYAQALSEGQHYLAQYQQDGPHTLELRRVEVLPPGAFPLPAGEVE